MSNVIAFEPAAQRALRLAEDDYSRADRVEQYDRAAASALRDRAIERMLRLALDTSAPAEQADAAFWLHANFGVAVQVIDRL